MILPGRRCHLTVQVADRCRLFGDRRIKSPPAVGRPQVAYPPEEQTGGFTKSFAPMERPAAG